MLYKCDYYLVQSYVFEYFMFLLNFDFFLYSDAKFQLNKKKRMLILQIL